MTTAKSHESNEIVSVDVPRATHSGEMEIGGVKVLCHVLEDGTALISKNGVIALLTAAAGKGDLGRYIDRIPGKPQGFSFLPTSFKTAHGPMGHGLAAAQVTMVMQLYLAALLAGELHPSQQHIGRRCGTIISALAAENLTKKVYEATGYSEDRVKREYELKCKLYLLPEPGAYEVHFHEPFWIELFRLYRRRYHPSLRPPFFKAFIRKAIYDAIDPDVARRVKELNPNPHHGSAHTQYWRDISLVHSQQLRVVTLMRASASPRDFWMRFRNDQKRTGLQLSFGETG